MSICGKDVKQGLLPWIEFALHNRKCTTESEFMKQYTNPMSQSMVEVGAYLDMGETNSDGLEREEGRWGGLRKWRKRDGRR